MIELVEILEWARTVYRRAGNGDEKTPLETVSTSLDA